MPNFKYYYMGFYIHSCQKMRYKGNFSPSFLLCPENYTWKLLDDDLRKKLDQQKYIKFGEPQEAAADNNNEDIEQVFSFMNNSNSVLDYFLFKKNKLFYNRSLYCSNDLLYRIEFTKIYDDLNKMTQFFNNT